MRRRFIRVRRKINVKRVITKFAVIVISLWVGNEILNAIASSMAGTTTVFGTAFKLIGITVDANNTVTGTLQASGFVTILGVVAISSVILEFVEFNF